MKISNIHKSYIIIILLLFLSVDYNLNDLKILLSVIILTLICNFYLKDIMHSYILAISLITILFVLNKLFFKYKIIPLTYENFDSLQKIEKDYKKVNKDHDELTKDSLKLINLDPASDDEDEVVEKNKNKNIDDYNPAVAQRETYRMIDTVKQLKTTVESLAPTIKEGRKILETFKKLDINIKDVL